MYTFGILGENQPFDPLVLLILAIILDAILGDMAFLFKIIKHPIVIIGKIINFLDQKLNRKKRGESDRAIRGALSVLAMVFLSGIFGYSVSWLSFNHPIGWVVELFILLTLLAGRSLFDHVKDVANALKLSVEDGRNAVSHIVGRDAKQLDAFGVARAAIESTAENFCDGVIAPVFWYILFGLPGLIIYKTINTMDSMIGYKNSKYKAFGMTAARLDDILNLIPARLSALFLILASFFTPNASPLNSIRTVFRDSNKHRSMNAGWPEAAMAGALNVALAGPRRYTNSVANDPWIGNGSAKALITDINRALFIYIIANLINLVWISSLVIIRLNLTT